MCSTSIQLPTMSTSEKKEICNVAVAVAELPRLRLQELRARWKILYRREVPKAFGFDLLRRSIAYKIQENFFGGLSPESRRALNRLKTSFQKTTRPSADLNRRMQSGCVLVRDWQGRSYRVTVVDNRFEFEGRNYSTLSQIAREITGTNWNGPRFFGLRKAKSTIQNAWKGNHLHRRARNETA